MHWILKNSLFPILPALPNSQSHSLLEDLGFQIPVEIFQGCVHNRLGYTSSALSCNGNGLSGLSIHLMQGGLAGDALVYT